MSDSVEEFTPAYTEAVSGIPHRFRFEYDPKTRRVLADEQMVASVDGKWWHIDCEIPSFPLAAIDDVIAALQRLKAAVAPAPTPQGHDRGTFGALLGELRDTKHDWVSFFVELNAAPEDDERWSVSDEVHTCTGRTGEEALRRLVEKLRGQPR